MKGWRYKEKDHAMEAIGQTRKKIADAAKLMDEAFTALEVLDLLSKTSIYDRRGEVVRYAAVLPSEQVLLMSADCLDDGGFRMVCGMASLRAVDLQETTWEDLPRGPQRFIWSKLLELLKKF